jgi:aminoglycoside phosphotransferase (APT) family kinase protein
MRRELDELARALAPGGFTVPATVRVHGEPSRRVVELGDDRFAFVAGDAAGRSCLARERAVLAAISGKLSVAIPRVLWVAEDGGVDVRLGVGGLVDPFGVYTRACDDVDFAAALGTRIGAVLAELHAVEVDETLLQLLPRRVQWPEPSAWIRERLPRVIEDRGLIEAIERALARFDAFVPAESDRRLVHGDVGLHNLVFDRSGRELLGIFDFAEAAWADRHWDLRHLAWQGRAAATLEAAMASYGVAGGAALSRGRVVLYNAATAFSYLAFRDGIEAEREWCGRTLAGDLAWTRAALAELERIEEP